MPYRVQYYNPSGRQDGGLRKGKEQKGFYAKTASISYAKTREDRLKKMKEYKFDKNWELDPTSDYDVAILVNKKTKEIVGAVRGTNPTNLKDLKDDALIVTGKEKRIPRVKQIKKKIQAVQKKTGFDDLTFSGHSLGSAISKQLADDMKVPAVLYNRGASPANSNPISALWNKIFKKESDTIHYSVPTDILSVSATLFGNEKTKHSVPRKKGVISHSLKQFIDDEPKQEGSGKCGCISGKGGPGSGDHSKNVKKNKWLIFVDQIKRQNKGMKYSDVLRLASKSYVK